MPKLPEMSAALERWLTEDALPLWRAKGVRVPDGGFVETIDLSGSPTRDSLRSRVQPRQTYCFAEAGLHGWSGDWQGASTGGLAFFDRVFLQPSGFYGALADADGHLLDPAFDIYNQAFALLAFATMARAFPERLPEMAARSTALKANLEAWCKHPFAGFDEDNPPRLPLCSNPHMHLFEACLASEDVPGFDQIGWTNLADEIAGLCMDHFIDAQSGALREFFDADWSPMPGDLGRVVEPGHQFEWAWLLLRWGERRGDASAIVKARRLFEIGEVHGICSTRQVAIMQLNDDFSVRDALARLWPQTEWLKAAVRLAAMSEGEERDRYLISAERAMSALNRFLDVPVAGLWRDKLPETGVFIEEAAPASTFYHILCAIYEVKDGLACMGM